MRDPVCNMEIDEQSATGRSEHEGHNYYFCSESCKNEFDQHPEQYVGQGEQRAGTSA